MDMYGANQFILSQRNAAQVKAFDAAAAALGIGENGNGETVPVADFGGRTVTRPRFEAECVIRNGEYVEISVSDRKQEKNGYQTDAVSLRGKPAKGGTEEARALVDRLREILTAEHEQA